ncbi:unnamed protein product [Lathyrus oleraceus]|uniref:Uncharacterized protein n=1 Tax=Pisum sativum TaxID=3888 RepID=A0A9D5BRN6_PEA|nr:uncharacterized protein LOC127084330 [Pisum sativum]KAI5448361.1 hypothetical protein KIW84_015692 [Pisum sativum]
MKKKHFHGGTRIALNPHNSIVIRIPDTKVLRILSRSLFLVMVLVALPFIGNILNGFSFTLSSHSFVVSKIEFLHDMAEKGIYRNDDKALIVSSPPYSFGFEGIDVVMDNDYERKSLFLDESYDFVFTSNSSDVEFVDRIVKIGGIVVMLNSLRDKPSKCAFKEQLHYRVVYLRSYGSSMIVALRKTSSAIKHQYGT